MPARASTRGTSVGSKRATPTAESQEPKKRAVKPTEAPSTRTTRSGKRAASPAIIASPKKPKEESGKTTKKAVTQEASAEATAAPKTRKGKAPKLSEVASKPNKTSSKKASRGSQKDDELAPADQQAAEQAIRVDNETSETTKKVKKGATAKKEATEKKREAVKKNLVSEKVESEKEEEGFAKKEFTKVQRPKSPGSAKKGSAKKGSAKKGSAKKGSAKKGSAKKGSAKKGSTKKEDCSPRKLLSRAKRPAARPEESGVPSTPSSQKRAKSTFVRSPAPSRKIKLGKGRRVWVFDPPEGDGYAPHTEVTLCHGTCIERIEVSPEMYMIDFEEGKFNYLAREIFTSLKDARQALEKIRPGATREMLEAKKGDDRAKAQKKGEHEEVPVSPKGSKVRSVFSPPVSASKTAAPRAIAKVDAKGSKPMTRKVKKKPAEEDRAGKIDPKVQPEEEDNCEDPFEFKA